MESDQEHLIPQRAERYSCLERRNGCMAVVEPAAAINEENHAISSLDFYVRYGQWNILFVHMNDKSSFFPIRIHGFLPEHVR
jgi:hypothetical protein